MRIHSDILTYFDIFRASRDLPGVYADFSSHGSRSRAAAFEVSLEGNGSWKNSGRYGAATWDMRAATWDEWGAFLGYLFNLDPDMLCGSSPKYAAYDGIPDYRFKTGSRFDSGTLPADTHKRHSWKYDTGGRLYCTKCTAEQNVFRDTVNGLPVKGD